MNATISEEMIEIPMGSIVLRGDLRIPPRPSGLVIFAHGSGSSRFSSRNRQVAESLYMRGFATLLMDLLTPQEESVDIYTSQYRFDIPRLGERVAGEPRNGRRPSPQSVICRSVSLARALARRRR